MNPFEKTSVTGKKGFYFDQLSEIQAGVSNAKILKVMDGDKLHSARMYINKYYSGTGENYKTKFVDGNLWVVNLGSENK
jgi:hypothetical protein